MTLWTKRPCYIGAQTQAGDYVVLRDGIELGRVLPAPFVPGTLSFQWSSWTHPAQNGRAETLYDALRVCRNAIANRPVPPHITRRLEQYAPKGCDNDD